MSDARPLHPSLFAVPPDGGEPRLLAQRCACDFVAFPPHGYGCERCGRLPEAAEPVQLSTRGTLTGFATVFAHRSKSVSVPYVVGVVALDAGPTVEVLLGIGAEGLRVGQEMHAVPITLPAGHGGGDDTVDLRWVP